MNEMLRQSWWMFAIRGVAALVFGVLAVLWPEITLLVLVAFFAAYAFFVAAAYIAAAVKNRKSDKGWWLVLLLGLVALGAGAVAILHPLVTAIVLVLLMGANAFISGILDIAMAIRLRRETSNKGLLVLTGIVSILFGVLVMVYPGAGAIALVWLVSLHAILTGVLLLSISIALRRTGKPSGGAAPGNRDRLVGA
ncbi:MAG: DUF308 domain-containing protein [Acidobacteria bacterium]|nr:DUF308 domain-containing protein [Acidobacteriota bacterium]